jgi:hypothetical protein
VDDDAAAEDIKAAYRRLAKVCHPDFTGEAGHNMCVLLNEVRAPCSLSIVNDFHMFSFASCCRTNSSWRLLPGNAWPDTKDIFDRALAG